MRQVLLASILVLFGLVAGYFLPHGEKGEVEDDQETLQISKKEYQQLKLNEKRAKELDGKVAALSEINLEEYVTLKDQKEKYLKADELFGRIMLLFLADLSLHMNSEVKSWANQSSAERREEFNKVFAGSEPSKEATSESFEAQIPMMEVDSIVDERQFQKEQEINRKQPFKGRMGFNDKLGRNMRNMMDSRVVQELWGKKIWKGPTQPLQFEQLVFYEVKRNGLFRRGRKTQASINFRLEIAENKAQKKYTTRLKISIKNSKRFYFHFDDKVEAVHPTSHNKFGDGPCRGVILKGERGIQVYLSFLRDGQGKPDDKLIVGRLVDTRLKNPFLGNFLLEREQ